MTDRQQFVLDHLLIASPDLRLGCDYVEELFGNCPTIGGSHPGIGTHNAVLGLEDDIYIEIIAPDPAQDSSLPLSAYLRRLQKPDFLWWAARCNDIEHCKTNLAANQIEFGDTHAWSRELPDGRVLSWQMLLPTDPLLKSALPFFIQWDDMNDHPTTALEAVGKVTSMRITHLEVQKIQAILADSVEYQEEGDAAVVVEFTVGDGTVSLSTPAELPPAFGRIR